MLANMVRRVEELAKIIETIKAQYHTAVGQWQEAKQILANLEAGAQTVENGVDNLIGDAPNGQTNNSSTQETTNV